MTKAKAAVSVLWWIAVIGFSLFFLWTDVFPYLQGYRSPSFGSTFFRNQFFVVVHLVGGTAALLTGPFQFWPGFREKNMRLHRLLGKVYLIGGVLVGFSALRSSLISKCAPCRISLFLTGVLLLITLITAWLAIKKRHIKPHRQFMIRSYVLMLAFVFVRIDSIFPLDFMFGQISDPTFRRTVNEYFFSFFPLIITEILMVWRPYILTLRSR